jgi:hypothetical protein
MRDDIRLPPGLPPMSMREERALKQRVRQQIKPKSVALWDQAKNFYMAVGMGISHWARMEIRLVQVMARLLRISEAKAGLITYSIINLHTLLQIIDELFVLDGTYPKSLKVWRTVAGSIRAENDIRVRLAHHALSQDEDGTGVQAYLRPSRFDVRSKSTKAKPLTMVEIGNFVERVGKIHDQLISLLERIKKRKSLR